MSNEEKTITPRRSVLTEEEALKILRAEMGDAWTVANPVIAGVVGNLLVRVSRGVEQIKEIRRLVWLADHGGTTEQIGARAELMRLGLRRRPMLTEEKARAWANALLDRDGPAERRNAVAAALLCASRGEVGP